MLERVYFSKTDDSCESFICHYWYLLNITFKFQPKLYPPCHDLMQNAMNFMKSAIVTVEGNDFGIYFFYMSKDESKKFIKKC